MILLNYYFSKIERINYLVIETEKADNKLMNNKFQIDKQDFKRLSEDDDFVIRVETFLGRVFTFT